MNVVESRPLVVREREKRHNYGFLLYKKGMEKWQ